MRTWYDRRGHSKNAVRTQLCLSFYFRLFLALCSRLPATLYIFWSPYSRRTVAVRSDGGISLQPFWHSTPLVNHELKVYNWWNTPIGMNDRHFTFQCHPRSAEMPYMTYYMCFTQIMIIRCPVYDIQADERCDI